MVWREIPTTDYQYDGEHRSHIRGNTVNYFVEDGLHNTEDVPLPAKDSNVVISDITGTCSTEGPCYSNEDPKFPDVSASYGDSAVVVWHQKYPGLDVKGDFLTYSGELGMCGFADVPPGYWAEEAICRIYDLGTTKGCSVDPLMYCPDRIVSKASMAVFLLRSLHGGNYTLPPATGTIFTDVDGSEWYAPWVEQLYKEGITSGCSADPLMYCPNRGVSKAAMALFIVRTFGF